MAQAGPLSQFEIKPLIPIKLGGLDLSFTNSAFFMTLTLMTVVAFLVLGMRRRALVPDAGNPWSSCPTASSAT